MVKSVNRFLFFLPVLLLIPLAFVPFSGQESEQEIVFEKGDFAEVALQSAPPCNCTVTQGSFSASLPFMSTNSSAVNFYNYGNPIATSANTGLEMSETLLIMMHEDVNTGNTSLIVILDQGNDGSGGNANISFNCMPTTSFVAFSDEPGELTGSPPTFTGNFNWNPCCTDGGVIGGFSCGNTITINPSISSGITAFSLVYGTPAVPTYVNMPQINCPITINCGGASCCNEVFEFSAVAQNATCESSFDGAIDLTTDCATSPTFLWSNGAFTEDISGLAPGNYSVTITDQNGCSETASYTVDATYPSPQPTINGPTEFCTGELVELWVSGNYSTYTWSNASSSPSIFVSTPGIYSVTVTNAEGCTGTASTTLTENPLPEPEITGPTAVCIFNDTITLEAGAGFSSYQWSTGDNTQDIDITEAGGYFVTVSNSVGCTNFDFLIVEPLVNPFPDISGPSSICEGEPIDLDAGAGYNSYEWSTGDDSQVIVAETGGTYSVTVTNADNCEGIDSQYVAESPVDTVFLTDQSCNPQDTGIFVQTFSNQYGCDSVEILNVSFNESDSIFLTDQSCNPQDTGIFVQTFSNQYGCDSVEILNVSFNESDSVFLTDQSCNPQDTGIFVQALTNQLGCDSIVVTSTTLLLSDTTEVFEQSCDPANVGITEELFVNSFGCDSLVITTTEYILVDTTYLAGSTCDSQLAGVFEEMFIGSDGCDSLVITTVNLLLSDTTFLDANTCDIAQAGQSEQLLTNQSGCDSLVVTNTTFVPADTTLFFLTSCDPAEAGVFEEILANSVGCDSFVITTVNLLPTDTTSLFQTSCDPSQAGTEEVLLSNQFGCDSLLIVTTTYALADSTQVSNTTCDPSAAGIFLEILMSADGCDSVVTTTITLLPSDTVEVFSQTCDPMNVGVFETLLSNQFGCDSLVVTTMELLPSDTVYLQAITCDTNQAGLSQEILPNQFGCDSLIITNTAFVPADTTLLFAESCDPGQVGTVGVVLQNVSGCDSLVITATSLLPSDTTLLQAFSCDPNQVGTTEVLMTNSYGCDSLVVTNTALLPTDTTWLFFGSCSPMDTGLVVTQLSNQYGCDSLVFSQTELLPATECNLNALILGDTIGCSESFGSLWFTFLDGTPPFEYAWSDQSGNTGSGSIGQGGTPQEVSGLLPGEYTFEILDINGLMTTLNGTVFQPSPIQIDLEISSDSNGYGISCFGASDGTAAVTVVNGGLEPYSYSWSNGNQTGEVEGLGEGWYFVTVTGAAGCIATDSFLLESPDSLQFSFTELQPDCFSAGQGAIAVNQVDGGIEPYQYSLGQGSDWQMESFFGGLAPGAYEVEVEDANGCTASSIANINSFSQLTVSLGQDEIIEYGDSLTLQPIILPLSMFDSIYWGGVDCPSCLDVTVAPTTTSTYSVTVFDSLGCEASDEIQVVVKKNFHVFIPNAFSPDFNGINDNFTIFGSRHLVRIKELQIFDRWGEPVFTGFNLPPNDPSYGWDGSYRGKQMNPAVYVYFAVLEFVDGSDQLVEGDVMLVR